MRRGLARTFQLPELFDELTVREHLTLPRRLALAPSRSWSDPLTGRFLRPDLAENQEVDTLLDSLGLAQVADTCGRGPAARTQPPGGDRPGRRVAAPGHPPR